MIGLLKDLDALLVIEYAVASDAIIPRLPSIQVGRVKMIRVFCSKS